MFVILSFFIAFFLQKNSWNNTQKTASYKLEVVLAVFYTNKYKWFSFANVLFQIVYSCSFLSNCLFLFLPQLPNNIIH